MWRLFPLHFGRYSVVHRDFFALWISPSADVCHSPTALKRKFYRLAATSRWPSTASVTDEVEAQRRQSAVAMGIATPPINNNGKRLALLNSRYLPSIIIRGDATPPPNASSEFFNQTIRGDSKTRSMVFSSQGIQIRQFCWP